LLTWEKDAVYDTGMFKTLVSGDSVPAQRKYGQPFSFNNHAKLIFSANMIPKSKDDSYAYYRRWVIVPFRKTFEGENDDTELIKKLITPEELSGLLNVALAAIKALKDEGGFVTENVIKIQRIYESNASLVHDFIEQECSIDLLSKDVLTPTATIRDAYIRFCANRGSKALDMNILGEELKHLGIENKPKRIHGKQVRCYFGIRLMAEILA
jgi:putative DNA primase/helicase